MNELLIEIRNCKVCENFLELGAHPIIAASPKSKIVIIGQAPGRIVHQTGIPWNDKSGDNLRNWSLPHPSSRNNIWQAKNKWFEIEVLTILKSIIKMNISKL